MRWAVYIGGLVKRIINYQYFLMLTTFGMSYPEYKMVLYLFIIECNPMQKAFGEKGSPLDSTSKVFIS